MGATVQLPKQSREQVDAEVSHQTSWTETRRPHTSEMARAAGSAPDEPRYGGAAFRGGVAGFIVAAALVGLVGAVLRIELGSVLGLAAYVGFFGGIGYGAMVGASLCMMRSPGPDAVNHKRRTGAARVTQDRGPQGWDTEP